jgi:hypothetical protein
VKIGNEEFDELLVHTERLIRRWGKVANVKALAKTLKGERRWQLAGLVEQCGRKLRGLAMDIRGA